MNMMHIYQMLKANIANLEGVRDDFFMESSLESEQAILRNIKVFGKIPSFEKHVDRLRETITSPNFFPSDVLGNLDGLILKVTYAIDLFEQSGFVASDPIGFRIKMPPTSNFQEFAEDIEKLSTIFQQCSFLNVAGEQIELRKTESGSIWLVFGVVAVAATATCVVLMNFAKFVDKCVAIRSHKATYEQQRENLRSLKISNDLLETNAEMHKKVIAALYNSLANELDQTASHEEKQRTIGMMKKFVVLLDKGMEVIPTLTAPIEVKNLFPTPNDNILGFDVMKQLPGADQKDAI